ncbi:MAG TPA: ATP cone domain-containing protein, partial [Spirochaetota bacterium]|nr:ATP cone domain-containing protein [Spirochaetota bacterium]
MSEGTLVDWRKEFLGLTKSGKSESIIKHIIKRDGQLEIYDRSKIFDAINKAAKEVGEEDPELIERLTDLTEEKLEKFMGKRHKNSAPAIEEIQDIVETVLIEERQVALAKAFIIYRAKRAAARSAKQLMLDIDSTMDGYLSQMDWRVNE